MRFNSGFKGLMAVFHETQYDAILVELMAVI